MQDERDGFHNHGTSVAQRPRGVLPAFALNLQSNLATDYNLVDMNDLTRVMNAIAQGDSHAAQQLLPLVYEELRRLATQRLAHVRPGQTLQATALVHEAYLRLVDGHGVGQFDGRGHFFAAAAEAMRRFLIDSARRKMGEKHGGGRRRVDLDKLTMTVDEQAPELLALDDALSELERHDPQAAMLVKLRFFAGLGHEEAATAMGIGRRCADRLWALARAWLYQQVTRD